MINYNSSSCLCYIYVSYVSDVRVEHWKGPSHDTSSRDLLDNSLETCIDITKTPEKGHEDILMVQAQAPIKEVIVRGSNFNCTENRTTCDGGSIFVIVPQPGNALSPEGCEPFCAPPIGYCERVREYKLPYLKACKFFCYCGVDGQCNTTAAIIIRRHLVQPTYLRERSKLCEILVK